MEKATYVCIFENKPCPAKAAWKLSPESLVEFCKICVEKMKWDTLMKGMEAIAGMQKNTPSKELESKLQMELELEKTRLNHDIELKKLDLEEKKFEYEKTLKDKNR